MRIGAASGFVGLLAILPVLCHAGIAHLQFLNHRKQLNGRFAWGETLPGSSARRLQQLQSTVAACQPVEYLCGSSELVLDVAYTAITTGPCTQDDPGECSRLQTTYCSQRRARSPPPYAWTCPTGLLTFCCAVFGTWTCGGPDPVVVDGDAYAAITAGGCLGQCLLLGEQPCGHPGLIGLQHCKGFHRLPAMQQDSVLPRHCCDDDLGSTRLRRRYPKEWQSPHRWSSRRKQPELLAGVAVGRVLDVVRRRHADEDGHVRQRSGRQVGAMVLFAVPPSA